MMLKLWREDTAPHLVKWNCTWQSLYRESVHVAEERKEIAVPARSGYPIDVKFNYLDFFEQNADRCGGELVIKGTRVTVRTLLASLAEGGSVDQILADFPTVSRDAMRAVIAFAATSAEEDMPVPPAPAAA
jgi:Uncharacterized conserved protein